jgi:hypothetical protein
METDVKGNRVNCLVRKSSEVIHPDQPHGQTEHKTVVKLREYDNLLELEKLYLGPIVDPCPIVSQS